MEQRKADENVLRLVEEQKVCFLVLGAFYFALLFILWFLLLLIYGDVQIFRERKKRP
jgi:hypothetical protein